MKKIRNWIARKILVRIFAEVSTSSCASKEAGAITIFDACRHYGFRLGMILCVFALSSCATDTGDPKKDARGRATNEVGKQVFNALLSWGLNEGVAQMTGQNGQDAAAGAFGAAKSVAGGINISNIMRAYAGPEVAAKVDEQLAIANPQTPQQRSYFANVAGAALQLAANQLTKS